MSTSASVAGVALVVCAARMVLVAKPIQARQAGGYCRWTFPGLVSVFDNAGNLVVKSLAGQPYVPDGLRGDDARPGRQQTTALKAAATILEGLDRMPQCRLRVPLPGRAGVARLVAFWRWPGVLTVVDEDTDKVLAESEPGRPEVPRQPPAGSTCM